MGSRAGCIMRKIHCINIYIQLTVARLHCCESPVPKPTKGEATRGQNAINIIVRPSTHFLSACHFPRGWTSYTSPPLTEVLWECHLPFLCFAPEEQTFSILFLSVRPLPAPRLRHFLRGLATQQRSDPGERVDLTLG